MPNQDRLEITASAFEDWRNNRSHSAHKTPETLRQQALALLPHYSTSKIIRTLKLSHTQLKIWSGKSKRVNKPLKFVALPPSSKQPCLAPLALELVFTNGCQMKLTGEISSEILSSLLQTLSTQGSVSL